MAIDIQQFQREACYQAKDSPQAILADIAVIRGLDTVAEGKQRLWGWLSVLFLVVGGIALLVGGPGTIVGIIFLMGFGVALLIRRGHKNSNVEDRRYELVAGLLPLLEADMNPDALIDINLDLRELESHAKLDRTEDFGRITERYYVDPWLKISGRFLDGTSFQIGFLDRMRVRHVVKYSASGKRKSKTKRKAKLSIVVQLKVKPDRYPALPHVADSSKGAVQIPPGCVVLGLKSNGPTLSLKVEPPDYWDAEVPGEPAADPSGANIIAMMMLSLYQVLTLAKTIDKGQKSA